jgi:hypothetical protein
MTPTTASLFALRNALTTRVTVGTLEALSPCLAAGYAFFMPGEVSPVLTFKGRDAMSAGDDRLNTYTA